MEADGLRVLVDGIFSKSLQARRMLARGAHDVLPAPLSETVLLARRLEAYTAPEALAAAEAALDTQRWRLPVVELGVADGYVTWAPGYDEERNPLIHVEEPVTRAVIGDVAGQDVLDAACGTGRYALWLAQSGARVCGVDGSEAMLAEALMKREAVGLEVDLRRGDLTALPCADASFDLVVCALALCHVADLGAVMRELARVLRPGGRLVISDFHPTALLLGWRTALRREEAVYFIENHTHLIADLVQALLAQGLSVTDLREEVVDDRLTAMLGEVEVERYRGLPLAVVLAARKEEVR